MQIYIYIGHQLALGNLCLKKISFQWDLANFVNHVRMVLSASANGNFLLLSGFSLVLRFITFKNPWVKQVLRLLGEPDQSKQNTSFRKRGHSGNC